MNLFKSISVYAFSNIGKSAVGFLLIPVITKYLDPAQNGDLSTIVAVVTMLTSFVMLSSNGAINLEYFRKDHGSENYSSYLSSALVNPLWISLVLLIFFWIGAPWLSEWLALDKMWLILIPVLCVVNLFMNFTSTIYQAQKKPIHHAIYNISFTTIDLLLAILLIAFLEYNWEGRLWATLVSKTLFTLIGIYILWQAGFLNFNIKKEYIQDAFWFGLPLVPHLMSANIMDVSDRFFIRELVSREEQGIYDIGYKIGSIVLIFQAALIMAWTPFFYEKMKAINTRNKTYIVSGCYGLMLLLLVSCFVLTIFAPVIYMFLDQKYASGIQYVFWVALAYVFLGFYKIFAGFIFFTKRTKILSYIAIFNIATNLTLNYFFISEYGTIGAAYATAISYFIFFVVTAIISQIIHPMPWFNFKAIIDFLKNKYYSTGS